MDAFTQTWNSGPQHCGPGVITDSLERIDGYGEAMDHIPPSPRTQHEQQLFHRLADVLRTCPDTDIAAAVEHLRVTADSDQHLETKLRPAQIALQFHTGDVGTAPGCDCADKAWKTFKTETDQLLVKLSGGYWFSHDVVHDEPRRDLVREPDMQSLLTRCRWLGPDEDPTYRVPNTATVGWDGQNLLFTITVRQEERRMRFTPLSPARSDAALTLAAKTRGGPGDVALIASRLDEDVAVAFYNLAMADTVQSSGLSRRWRDGEGLLHDVAALKQRLPAEEWETVTRLTEGWAGTLDELEHAAAGVMAAS